MNKSTGPIGAFWLGVSLASLCWWWSGRPAPHEDAPVQRPAHAAERPVRRAPDRSEARLGELVRKVAELERLLAEDERRESSAHVAAPAGGERAAPGDDAPDGGRAATDAATPNHVAAVAAQLDFLSAIDVNGMGRQERRSHERLIKRMRRREEIREALLSQDIEPEAEERLAAEAAEVERSITELRGKVRKNLFSILAGELGVPKEDMKLVVGTINEIVDATTAVAD